MKLDNKIVLVTGVSSGIGAATASLLRAHGAQVIGVDLKAPHMTLDGFVQGDLSSAENIERLLPQLPARLDSLCNIAGVPGTANPRLLARVNYLG
ncbi:SDR family NAD(P)-dependent oxidoreductase, partial [Pseudomonas sp. PDM25]